MKKMTSRIARTAAAFAAVFAVAAPMTLQPAVQIGTIVASAATTPSVAELTYDMACNPEKFFTVSSQKNADGCYTITNFHKPDKYKNTKLTILTVPGKIGGKTISRISGAANGSRFPTPAINDPDVTSIVFSYGLRVMESDAISNCPKLETITLPSSFSAFSYECVRFCSALTRFYTSSNILTIPSGFLRGCPNMHDAWSERAAYLMIKDGVDITTLNGTPIIRDAGSTKKPVMSAELESAMKSSYEKLEVNDAVLTDTYYRIYSRYLLSQVIGVTNSMTFNQKVARIYNYVANRASYDYSLAEKSHWAGSVFFGNKTVCAGYARSLAYLFREAGIQSYRVCEDDIVDSGSGAHEFNLVYNNDMYFIVDGTCGPNTQMMNQTELKYYHNTEDFSEWKFYTDSGSWIQYDSYIRNKVKYALGDVNCDGRVNHTDRNILSEYVNASYGQKANIASRYGLSTAQFECLADADCNGTLNKTADANAMTAIQRRFNF